MLDGSLIANEIINVTSKEKLRLLLFKVDFEKAFDSVNWNFLMNTMAQMGFGVKWRKWIYACLSSASVSIHINGSPSKEFPMKRGLRQGDPLSPFLFLIVAEALQVMITDLCNKYNYRGISLYNDGANISLIQYADDALFFGELLKINVKHLIRRSMRKIADWTKVINRFSKKLASWKANLLSIGGRLTLVKSVLGSLSYPRLMAVSGLVIKAKHMRLLGKWKWRCNNERGALWRKVITEMHGSSGGFDLMVGPRKSSTWSDIMSSCNKIEQLGVPLNNLMVQKIYRGTQTLFWTDNWLKDSGPLKDCFPCLFASKQHKYCLVADRWVLKEDVWQDEAQDDKWEWALTYSRKFTVA
ncbi:RNA-directed DNA polymerase, eukaryota, reverse transcriptase zinc-binding domain protein [Tanacetum coccineum]|uniref:RNA-directed DNA polymerase, eukaryota, reverse transcriptase zinc-binding domain protein n=1 Tax=Tanacetum coccineum TaxID=301880 RepID=A0ABQ4XRG2_9ASTR